MRRCEAVAAANAGVQFATREIFIPLASLIRWQVSFMIIS